MRHRINNLVAIFISASCATAGVPLAWQVSPANPAPVAFDRHHGETLEFRCTFAGFGELPFSQDADVRLFYQTNGMGAAWWSLPATVSSNVFAATFPPQADPGADRLTLFFGAPSNAYASAVLCLRPSPGFAPNVLPPPDMLLWSNMLAAATNGMLRVETDPTVPAWAKEETPPPSMTTNDVRNIVTAEIGGWGSWTCDPSEYFEQPIEIRLINNAWAPFIGERQIGMPFDKDIYGEAAILTWGAGAWEAGDDYTLRATRTYTPSSNALGLARLTDLPALTNDLPTKAEVAAVSNSIPVVVTAAVYDVHDLRWDEEEQILYWCKIVGGHDLCIAVTNINLTHPTNAVLLKAWREANR